MLIKALEQAVGFQYYVAADSLTTGLMSLFGAAIREPLRIIACLVFACFHLMAAVGFVNRVSAALIVIIVYFNKKIRSVAASILKRNARSTKSC